MDRLLAGRAGTVTALVTNPAGELIDFDAVPAVVVKAGDGTATLASGTATRTSLGTYSLTVPAAATGQLDQLTCTWTGAIAGQPAVVTTSAEIVAALPVTAAEVRAQHRDLANVEKYPAAAIIKTRDETLDDLENAMRVTFTRRSARVTASGDDTRLLIAPHYQVRRLYAVTVDGASWDPDDVTVEEEWGGLYAPDGQVWTSGDRNIQLWYEHGWDAPPAPVARELRKLIAANLVPSALPDRATALATDAGQFRITVAGRDGHTGIPSVDEMIREFGYGNNPAVG